MPPAKADNQVRPFRVWREATPGSGVLVLDDRSVPIDAHQGANGKSRARFRLLTQETKAAQGSPPFSELSEADIDRMYGPMVRMAIAAVTPTAGLVNVIAHGYVSKRNLNIGRSGDRSFYNDTMQIEPAIGRMAVTMHRHVWGRYMLSRAATDDLGYDDGAFGDANVITDGGGAGGVADATFASALTHVALPCIFNPIGKDESGNPVMMPNRSRRPIFVTGSDVPTVDGGIHVFTFEGDPNARPWTYLQALRYLVALHGFDAVSFGLSFDELWGATRNGSAPDFWHFLDEDDVVIPSDRAPEGWQETMTRRANALNCETLSLLEAIEAISDATGMRMSERHEGSGNATSISVSTQMEFWTAGDRTQRTLGLQRSGDPMAVSGHHDAIGKLHSLSDIFLHNQLASLTAQRDTGNMASHVEVLGGRKLLQVTVELQPFWPPDADWDDVDSGSIGTKSDAAFAGDAPFESIEGSAFYNRFHTKGKDFGLGGNRMVGRLWGADFGGELDPSIMNRSTGPFTNYNQPARLSDLTNLVISLDKQVRRRRQMLKTIVMDDTGRREGVLVELSPDDGMTWLRMPITSKIGILTRQFAIYFENQDVLTIGQHLIGDDMRSIIFPGSSGLGKENFYHAYILNQLRVRVTCVIDLDGRIDEIAFDSNSAVRDHRITRLISAKESFRDIDAQSHGDNTLLGLGTDVLDGPRARRFALAMLRRHQGAALRGDPLIPWVALDDEFALGDSVLGIRRTKSDVVDISFGGNAARDGDFPVIVQKVFKLDGEQSTQLVLTDGELRRSNGKT